MNMNDKISTARWLLRALWMAGLIGATSPMASKAEDIDPLAPHRKFCEITGGTFEDLGGGDYRCCDSHGCKTCSANGVCVMECVTRVCCEYFGLSGDHCFDWSLPSSAEDVDVDGGSWELPDADHVYDAADPAADATDGMIIVVGGLVEDALADGTLPSPIDPDAYDFLQAQLDFMLLATMDPADLDALDVDAEITLPPVELLEGASAEQPIDSDPAADAALEAEDQTTPLTTSPVRDLRDHNAGRRGRARR